MKISRMLKSVNIALILFSLCCFSMYADSSYIVKKGDTLYSISRKYQITVPELRAANNLSENDVLKAGAKLVIPAADIENAAALSASKTSDYKRILQGLPQQRPMLFKGRYSVWNCPQIQYKAERASFA